MFGPIIARWLRWLRRAPSGEPRPASPGVEISPALASPTSQPPDAIKTQRVIDHVLQLTSSVAQDVGKHNANIHSLTCELAAVAQGDAAAVTSIICKLLAANQQLQSRLERAELKLQAHSRQLRDVVVVARTDSVTGLMNRRALDEELQHCLDEFREFSRPATLLLLDVDHFKRFNDAHGHLAGDQALTYVADVLRAESRDTDIVGRFGGEEFAVIFSAATAGAIARRAEAMRSAIGSGWVIFEDRELQITASAGLAQIAAGDDVTTWLKRADAALYAAKHDGRNCTHLSDGDDLVRIDLAAGELKPIAGPDEENQAVHAEASAELAAEAFSDITFVQDLSRRIAEWRRGGATFSVVLARIDGLSDSEAGQNDVADSVAIRSACSVARDCLRDMDLVTRWVQDGLAVLLPGAGASDARTVARRMRSALARSSAAAEDQPDAISMSMGIAEGIEGNDAQRVLQRAWLALQAARKAGPGSIFIHDGLRTLAVKTYSAAH
jgi:diguanylate cyclase